MDTLIIGHKPTVRLTAGQRQKIGEVARYTHLMGKKPVKAVNGETWYAFQKYNVKWRVHLIRWEDGTAIITVTDD